MNDERAAFALTCIDEDDPAPILVGVQAEGRLDGVLFEMLLRQTYRNTSDQVLEVVYTFPLPCTAVLLGFAAELNGQRQDGVIVAKHEAEEQYETSLAEGDAPVMLEAKPDGLHTANIGNLKPGDEIVLECRFAQLLSFEQGRLRVSLPTTIAPRFGYAADAGLQPQQVPLSSVHAEYPLTLSLTMGSALAGCTIESPTHRLATHLETDGSVRISLAAPAHLDRDVVVLVTPRETRPSLLVSATDTLDTSAPVVQMAALLPPQGAPRKQIALKLLVDCSGSMNGDSIRSAQAALRGVIAGLGKQDEVSLTRFGSEVEHLFHPSLASARTLRQLLPLVDGLQADLGGTEMESALEATVDLPIVGGAGGADLLLITDGEIWQAESMLALARTSHHRIFAIGVGSAPAEGVLRALAEETGGACEFVTPGEALETAARRMLHRMRQPLYSNVRIDWGAQPAWSEGPGQAVFGGDTVVAFAGFSGPIQPHKVRLLADDLQGNTIELARGEADAPCPGDSLSRIAAARRMAASPNAKAVELALRYQLMSSKTNCILIHRRAEAERTREQPELHRVSSMLAAGWGGMGSVMPPSPSVNSVRDSMALVSCAFEFTPIERLCIIDPASETTQVPEAPGAAAEEATLLDMARAVHYHLSNGGPLMGLEELGDHLTLHSGVKGAMDRARQPGLSRADVWLLLAYWVCLRDHGADQQEKLAVLQPLVDAIDPALTAAATAILERWLSGCRLDAWKPTRQRRLERAMARSSP